MNRGIKLIMYDIFDSGTGYPMYKAPRATRSGPYPRISRTLVENIIHYCLNIPWHGTGRVAVQSLTNPLGVYQPRRVCMIHKCSTGE